MTSPDLSPTAFVDFDHPEVARFAREAAGDASDDARTRAVRLYYAVRDGFRYDPYGIELSVRGLRASTVLADGRGFCINKAVLLAAGCRAIGVPARLGYADVRNHLSTERLRQSMGGSDVFYYHGYTSILLDGRWVKATPAFNLSLCEKFRLKPLEFDGTEDSIYHPFDLTGQRHMEYLDFRGEHADVPLADMVTLFEARYPGLARLDGDGDFDRDVERETAGG
ncbi:MAG: transglutaminase family protein [Panacagrimonas sp.]|jgi:transglutaminase-like putative cysteine protease|nr:transglutaminase family protein [Panacagrimonas sp.]MCC2656946.1 transglutaminase family protein [Panacagrimonas sp.]